MTRFGAVLTAVAAVAAVSAQSTNEGAGPATAPYQESPEVAAAKANEARAVQEYERSTIALWKQEAELRKSAIIHDQKLCGNRQKYLEAYATMGDEGRQMLKEACAHRAAPARRKR